METTYKIIGADGREYGPVTLTEVHEWSRQGRIAGNTQVLRSDESTWKSALQFPELALDQVALPPLTTLGPVFEPVGFWARVGASLIDLILLNVIFYLIWGSPTAGTNLLILMKQMVWQAFLQIVYYVLMNGSIGATVGKLAVGARIVFLDGSKIGFGTAFLRWLASMLSGLLLGIGYLMVAFREDKRGLHDLLVGTRVIYKR